MSAGVDQPAPRLIGRRTECAALDELISDVLSGASRVFVVRGEAGVGKSALLRYLSDRVGDWHLAKAVGVESEMELAYSGLHQLCSPLLDHLDRLPGPQRSALATVFGHESGPAPDRFLVGLATLTLLAEAADQRPLLCLIDDAQWFDAASTQVVSFVARRLLAERVALVCAARTGLGDDVLSGLPALPVDGLGDSEARALLLENLLGPLDAAICEQFINESHGNPLALLELPRTWNVADVAGGFGLPPLPARQPVAGKIEQSFIKRLLLLPSETQLLLLTAAAEPLGDPLLLHRAAGILGLDMVVSGPAVDAGLLEVTGRVGFAHPLVRSAAYRCATSENRHRVHRALAEATDPERDADRRAWHRARATSGPDEEIAAELERSADRAQARGGFAAAAAFLERAAALSPDAAMRAQRTLAAANAKQVAGDPETASRLLDAAVDGRLDERGSALALRLQGQIALDFRRGREAMPLLLEAASRLEGISPAVGREIYLEALMAASFVSEETLRHAAEAARSAPTQGDSASADDLLLAGLALRFTDGYAAGASLLKQALGALRDQDIRTVDDVRWPGIARRVAPDMFDDEAWRDLNIRSVQLTRQRGALGVLPLALNNLAVLRGFEGEFDDAATLIEESDAISHATSATPLTFGRLILAAFRGDESAVAEQIGTDTAVATTRSEGLLLTVGWHARALLHNGLSRYDVALLAAASASELDALCTTVWALPELIEAATRCGETRLAAAALERLTERTRAAETEWALGIEARSRALLSEGPLADELYREAADRLSRCRIAPERARAHLLHGEWLRREGRRVDAREQLRTAHDMLSAIGMDAFAERARRELAATGEKVRTRRPDTLDDLTAQEAQIAQLAHDGYTNPEIAAQLFLSPRTVEWHLSRVFQKLGVSSRRDLERALPASGRQPSATT